MKIFKNTQNEIIRMKLQSKDENPKYISFVDCTLDECFEIVTNYLFEYMDENFLPSQIRKAKVITISFIDTVSKKRKTESIKGFTIAQIIELITNKFTFNNLWFDEKKHKPKEGIKVLIRTSNYTAIGFWNGDSWRIWNHNSSEETSVIAWTELPPYKGLF